MIAHFYLLSKSFQNNFTLSNEEIEEKVKRLAEDVKLINQYKDTNKLYANYNELYPQMFYSDYTIETFICNPVELKKNGIDRDVINALQNIFNKSQSTTITSKEVEKDLLSWVDENNCHGLIAFHKINGIDDNLQIIYGIDSWYKFRRHFLGKYPKNADFFISECIKYFPNLFFHERNRVTIKTILDDSPKKIVYHLSALNDRFRDCQYDGLNRTEILKRFSVYAKLDEEASLEGDAFRKNAFTFNFINNDRINEPVCCEPHLKLCKNDYDRAKYFNDRRIYFHEGKSNIQRGRILIGHIGTHL
ncbi:hypothetical protein EZS27_030915 [termite gut metagenome]|uniref:Uncharacterized protein n=1 Tax=termite gut metagenome TaxID=433724 RepID=A0A5J4QBW4_9ZZZZ